MRLNHLKAAFLLLCAQVADLQYMSASGLMSRFQFSPDLLRPLNKFLAFNFEIRPRSKTHSSAMILNSDTNKGTRKNSTLRKQTDSPTRSTRDRCCSSYKFCYSREMEKSQKIIPLGSLKSDCFVFHSDKRSPKLTEAKQLQHFCRNNQLIFTNCMEPTLNERELKPRARKETEDIMSWLTECRTNKRTQLTERQEFLTRLVDNFYFLCNYHFHQAARSQECFRNKTRDCVGKFHKKKCLLSCESEKCPQEICPELYLKAKNPSPEEAFVNGKGSVNKYHPLSLFMVFLSSVFVSTI